MNRINIDLQNKGHLLGTLAYRLRVAMNLQELWPEAFSMGAIKTQLIGNPFSPEAIKLVLKRKDNASRTFLLRDLSKPLQDIYVPILLKNHSRYSREHHRIKNFFRPAAKKTISIPKEDELPPPEPPE